ncbi:hypothetical protein PR202_gb09073 [Eleusine coracana subsp. coracana]|uniref:Uncharacterized protein n=1 Tax=Eleusine coracana subsp. coracana TaxID=191504 RepID=A0AAV5EHD1_ELECO|nr:hypothetical protein PR202_gb09073 [Eleusine coracana subsp. coracana]
MPFVQCVLDRGTRHKCFNLTLSRSSPLPLPFSPHAESPVRRHASGPLCCPLRPTRRSTPRSGPPRRRLCPPRRLALRSGPPRRLRPPRLPSPDLNPPRLLDVDPAPPCLGPPHPSCLGPACGGEPTQLPTRASGNSSPLLPPPLQLGASPAESPPRPLRPEQGRLPEPVDDRCPEARAASSTPSTAAFLN